MKFVKKKMNLTKVALMMSLSSFFDFVQKWDLHDEDLKKKNLLSCVLFPLWFNFLHYLLKTNPEMKNKRVKNLNMHA